MTEAAPRLTAIRRGQKIEDGRSKKPILHHRSSILDHRNDLGEPDLRLSRVFFACRVGESHRELSRPIDLERESEAGILTDALGQLRAHNFLAVVCCYQTVDEMIIL